MPKTFAGFVLLLATLALLVMGKAVAGPPERASGKIVLDEVVDGLRQYRRAKSPVVRFRWLEKLYPTRDPRVVVAMGEVLEASAVWRGRSPRPDEVEEEKLGDRVHTLLWLYFAGGGGGSGRVYDWWDKNKDDLRRRAKQLPQ